jgi:hypothetical protein
VAVMTGTLLLLLLLVVCFGNRRQKSLVCLLACLLDKGWLSVGLAPQSHVQYCEETNACRHPTAVLAYGSRGILFAVVARDDLDLDVLRV